MIESPFFGLILAHLLGLVSDKNEYMRHFYGKLRLIAQHKDYELKYERQNTRIFLEALNHVLPESVIAKLYHQEKIHIANSNKSLTKTLSDSNTRQHLLSR